ncbi:MAG: hypothetical protein ACRDUY_07390 [Nitriliruptorales bacterium]
MEDPADKTPLAQLGPKFWNRPRSSRQEQDVSLMTADDLTLAEAVRLVNPRRDVHDNDGLRFTTAGQLRERGFTVRGTPSRQNPRHVSVFYECGSWRDEVAEQFDAAFGPVRQPEQRRRLFPRKRRKRDG